MNLELSVQQIRYKLVEELQDGSRLGSPKINTFIQNLEDSDTSGGINLEELRNAIYKYNRSTQSVNNKIDSTTLQNIEKNWLNSGAEIDKPVIDPKLVDLAKKSTLPMFTSNGFLNGSLGVFGKKTLNNGFRIGSLGVFEKKTLDNGKTIYFFITADHCLDEKDEQNLTVKLPDGKSSKLNILKQTGKGIENIANDAAIGYFISDNASIPSVPLSKESGKLGDTVINTGYPSLGGDTTAYENLRPATDSIDIVEQLGVQIVDSGKLKSVNANNNYNADMIAIGGQSGSPLFRINDNKLEIIGLASRGHHGTYDPKTGILTYPSGPSIPYAPFINIDKGQKPFIAGTDSDSSYTAIKAPDYPDLEKLIDDTIKEENKK
jgi:hypothetical protein